MDTFSESILRSKGYAPDINGQWKKSDVIKAVCNGPANKEHKASGEPCKEFPERIEGLRGRISATNDPRERMNGLERKFAGYLDMLVSNGNIVRWDYEAEKLRLADNTFYSPDFRVVENDGKIIFYETKGFWRDDARVKIKIAASLHPYRFTGVKLIKKEWVFERFYNSTYEINKKD